MADAAPGSAAPTSLLAQARPLFLLGLPRSGTTFCAKLLDSHPQILMTNEVRAFTFFQHAFREIPTGDAGGTHCSRVHGDEFVEGLRAYVGPVLRRTYERIAEKRGATDLRFWGDKNPHHTNTLPLMAECFPGARFVRMRRDPRDVVCSIRELHVGMGLVKSGEPPLAVLGRISRTVSVSIHMARRFFGGRPGLAYREVGYEEMLAAPDAGIQDLFGDFLGLEDHAAPRAWIAEDGRRDSHGHFLEKTDFVQRSVARWRRDLEPEQLRAVEEGLGDALTLEGYEPAATP